MTDKEIIKALECCCIEGNCKACPFHNVSETDCGECIRLIQIHSHSLILRLKKMVVETDKTEEVRVKREEVINKIRAEAVREFSHKVIDYIFEICVMPDIAIEMVNGIDNLAKEFDKDINASTNPEQPKETTTAKHCVGDKVRVRYDLSVGEWGNTYCNANMASQAGRILTIASEVGSFGRYRVEELGYIWNDLMFEDELYGNPEQVKGEENGNNQSKRPERS